MIFDPNNLGIKMEEIREDQLFIEALDWWEDGNSYTTIRTKLANHGLDQERIDYFIRMIDEYAIDAALVKQKRQKYKAYLSLGIFILLLGIFILIFTYVKSQGAYVYATYGLIFSGIGIAWVNYRNLKREDPDIREKRLRFKGIKQAKG